MSLNETAKALQANEQQAAAQPKITLDDPETVRQLLIDSLKTYQKKYEYKPGDLVVWKPHMRNRRFPEKSFPAIVIEVLTVPIMNQIVDHGSPYFRELLDMRIGVINDVGDLLTYMVESARFMPA